MTDRGKSDLPVLIVGGGPVGLALAGELGWRGVRCTLIERGNGAITQAKMDFVGVRTMEFCRRWGIVPWVHAAGYNRAYPQDCAWVSSLNGYELGREPFPAPQDEKPLPQSPLLARRAVSAGLLRSRTHAFCAPVPDGDVAVRNGADGLQ